METVLTGEVESLIYHNEDNGFTVFSLEIKGDDVSLVCVGNMPRVAEGEYVKLKGLYVTHAVYGKQFKVEYFEKVLPEGEIAIEKYLASGAIKGIRARMAKKIVKKFGKDTLDVLQDYPERLAEIKGITLAKAERISASFNEQNEFRRIIMYLQGHGISYSQGTRLYKRYREATIDIVKENPYIITDDVDGIGFKTADAIAHKMGIEPDSPYRVRSGIKYILSSCAYEGHTYLPRDVLLNSSVELLGIDKLLIENSLSQMQIERFVILETVYGRPCVYTNMFYYAEAVTAKKLLELARTVIDKSRNVSTEIKATEDETGVLLAENQKSAIASALAHGVLVITGGPGTGKTTTIKTIINILLKDGAKIELAAPTGRAAKRMSEATGMEAKTVHRLLEIAFDDKDGIRSQAFGKNEDSPLETDVVVVDESSMMDILLMSGLLKAMTPGTRLILVGDVDQLPSVGPGNVLKDIIDSSCIPVVRLDEVFRQASESAIIMNAHRINHGEYPVLNEKKNDFFFLRRETPERVAETILNLMLKRLPEYLNCSILDIQVLTPMRKSVLGVVNLNRVLQQYLNPPSPRKAEKEVHGIILRQGDKVMQIKNNYGVAWRTFDANGVQTGEGEGVFNGDMGVITDIDSQDETVSVLFDDNKLVEYEHERLDELELAYAITIHKSQGSEYKAVIIPVHSGPPMLMSRNLLYTGVTRARELAVIVGIPETLHRMVDNNKPVSRYTSLAHRLKKMYAFLEPEA